MHNLSFTKAVPVFVSIRIRNGKYSCFLEHRNKQFCITILGLMFYVQQYRVPCFTLAFLSIKNHANYKSRRNMNFFGEIIEDLPADDEHNTVDFGNTLNKYKNHMLSQILILTSLYQTRELRRFHGHFVVDEYFINSSSWHKQSGFSYCQGIRKSSFMMLMRNSAR